MTEDPIDRARRLAAEMTDAGGTGRAWALRVEDAAPGFSRLSMCVSDEMLNGLATAHGGMVFALADTAFAYAANSRGAVVVTESAAITYLDSAKRGERLFAEAQERARRGRLCTYAVSIRGEDGRPIADMLATGREITP